MSRILYIPTNADSYDGLTERQVTVVQDRMRHLAKSLGIDWELVNAQMGYPEDAHELQPRLLDLAMERSEPTGADGEAVILAAIDMRRAFPLPG